MSLPKIDIDSVPELETARGIFGSMSDIATTHIDDRVVVVMVYIYETAPNVTAV